MLDGLSTLFKVVRLRAWLVGIIALPIQVCYFSIFYLGLKTGRVFPAPQLLLVVFSLWLYLGYIVLINDLADRKTDASVGKGTPGRGHGLSPRLITVILALIVLANAAAVFSLHGGAIFDALWVVAFALGTSYSISPFKLKQRGALGLVVDAIMEKPIPILIIFSFFGYYGPEVAIFPVIGEMLDSVFKHQARDHDIDVKVGARTFAVILGKPFSEKVVDKFIQPVNVLTVVLAFVTVIVQLPQVRQAEALVLAVVLGVFVLVWLRVGKFVFHPSSPNWSDPLHWEDPPYVAFFNASFVTFLIPILGIPLAAQSREYLPILLLFLVSLGPYLVSYALVGLVRLKLV
jgi:4-hydroxybenzoate polyprenyltransferase